MEWVETTGRTIEQAKDAALDQLGVDEQDAEFEILDEPRTGLFGRTRGEARVRARIQPAPPRAKLERQRRKRNSNGDGKGGAKGSGDQRRGPGGAKKPGQKPGQRSGQKPAQKSGQKSGDRSGSAQDGASGKNASPGARPAAARQSSSPTDRTSSGRKRSAGTPTRENADAAPRRPAANKGDGEMSHDDVNVDEQADLMATFIEGLLDAFGAEGTIEQNKVDDDTIELQVHGDDLGLLIGPKGQTLQAVQDLARTYVQRKASGTHHGRVRIDIGGYRERRREALARFTEQIAEQVVSSGTPRALEPMNAADRKVVHDTANDLDGVKTSSEGDEPRRRVVISPS